MSMIVRPATPEDAQGIYEVETESFSVPWRRETIDRELSNTEVTRYYVLVRPDGRIEGYAGLWRVVDEGQVTNIALRKEVRRQGYGELLVRVMMEAAYEEGCTDIFLEVRFSNLPALSLYRKLGYEVLSIRKKYYSDPEEDAYVMDCKKEKYHWVVK